MINLVPVETRARLTRFYRERLAIVFLFSLFLCFVFGIIFLIPPYRMAKEKTASVKSSINISQTLSKARMESNPEFQVKELSRRVDLLSEKSTTITPEKTIEGILKDKPTKVKIDGFSYQNKGGWTMEVRGVAENREALLDFVKAMEGDALFSKVSVPVSDFVPEKELSFNIMLKIAKNSK